MQFETHRIEMATLTDEAVVLQQAIATLKSEQEGLKSENEARLEARRVELARLQVLCDSLKAQNDHLGQENAALWKERAGLKQELGSVSLHVRALWPFVLPPPHCFRVRVLWAILLLLLDSVDLCKLQMCGEYCDALH